jgi:hypothetical protein
MPRHQSIKKLTCEGTLRQVFIRVYRLEMQSDIISTQLCDLLPLSGSISSVPSPPFPVVNKCVCVGGGGVWGSGPQTDEHLPLSPFTGQYL